VPSGETAPQKHAVAAVVELQEEHPLLGGGEGLTSWHQWAAPAFEVGSTAPVPVGVLPWLGPVLAEAGRGLDYLSGAQNDDGGWGGAAGVGSTIEETALAISALSLWPHRRRGMFLCGLHYLLERIENVERGNFAVASEAV